MHKVKCNILVVGTLASGASALKDMLREYENINVITDEFDDYRAPGLVADQLSHVSAGDYPDVIDQITKMRSLKGRIIYKSRIWKPVCRFLPGSFWKNSNFGHRKDYFRKYLLRLCQVDLLDQLHVSLKTGVSYEQKIHLARQWVQNVGDLFSSDKDFTLFDQPILPWSDTGTWVRVFDPFKMICVFRDPKDQLADIIKRGIIYHPFRSPFLSYGQVNIMSIYGNDRKGMLQFQKDALLNRLLKLDLLEKNITPDKILLIDFEGLVNNYDTYRLAIEHFLGDIRGKQIKGKICFDPEKAKKNSIGIFRGYLTEEELNDLEELEKWYSCKAGKVLNRFK